MNAKDAMDWQLFLAKAIKKDEVELRIWRERYPREAGVVREIAEAQVDGREPIFPPSQVVG